MSEWWTYTLSDFLLFSPRTYYRMIEHHNEAVWPGQLATLVLGLVILGLLYRPVRERGRIISGIVAVLWAFVAGAFLWKRYATINWAATYFALVFAIEAVLLVWPTFRPRRDAVARLGVGLFVSSLALYPLLAPLLGRGWRQAEVFGVAPDPTALGTLGLLRGGAASPVVDHGGAPPLVPDQWRDALGHEVAGGVDPGCGRGLRGGGESLAPHGRGELSAPYSGSSLSWSDRSTPRSSSACPSAPTSLSSGGSWW